MIAPCWLMAVSLIVAAQDNSPAVPKEEWQRLRGTWKVVSGEFMGKAVGSKELGIDRVVIKGDRISLRVGEKVQAEYRLSIDPARKPKHMDWFNEKAKASLPVIYAMEGKQLKMCFPMLKTKPMAKPARPESFETKDKPLGMIIAERVE